MFVVHDEGTWLEVSAGSSAAAKAQPSPAFPRAILQVISDGKEGPKVEVLRNLPREGGVALAPSGACGRCCLPTAALAHAWKPQPSSRCVFRRTRPSSPSGATSGALYARLLSLPPNAACPASPHGRAADLPQPLGRQRRVRAGDQGRFPPLPLRCCLFSRTKAPQPCGAHRNIAVLRCRISLRSSAISSGPSKTSSWPSPAWASSSTGYGWCPLVRSVPTPSHSADATASPPPPCPRCYPSDAPPSSSRLTMWPSPGLFTR